MLINNSGDIIDVAKGRSNTKITRAEPKYPVNSDLAKYEGELGDYDLINPDDYKVYINKNGELVYKNGNYVFVKKEGEIQAYIYVMTEDGTIYIGDMKIPGINRLLHHTYFVKGGPIMIGGAIRGEGGRILEITNQSGHYLPEGFRLDFIEDEFRYRGIANIDFIKFVDFQFDQVMTIVFGTPDYMELMNDDIFFAYKDYIEIYNSSIEQLIGKIFYKDDIEFHENKLVVESKYIKKYDEVQGEVFKINEGQKIYGENDEDLTDKVEFIKDDNGNGWFRYKAGWSDNTDLFNSIFGMDINGLKANGIDIKYNGDIIEMFNLKSNEKIAEIVKNGDLYEIQVVPDQIKGQDILKSKIAINAPNKIIGLFGSDLTSYVQLGMDGNGNTFFRLIDYDVIFFPSEAGMKWEFVTALKPGEYNKPDFFVKPIDEGDVKKEIKFCGLSMYDQYENSLSFTFHIKENLLPPPENKGHGIAKLMVDYSSNPEIWKISDKPKFISDQLIAVKGMEDLSSNLTSLLLNGKTLRENYKESLYYNIIKNSGYEPIDIQMIEVTTDESKIMYSVISKLTTKDFQPNEDKLIFKSIENSRLPQLNPEQQKLYFVLRGSNGENIDFKVDEIIFKNSNVKLIKESTKENVGYVWKAADNLSLKNELDEAFQNSLSPDALARRIINCSSEDEITTAINIDNVLNDFGETARNDFIAYEESGGKLKLLNNDDQQIVVKGHSNNSYTTKNMLDEYKQGGINDDAKNGIQYIGDDKKRATFEFFVNKDGKIFDFNGNPVSTLPDVKAIYVMTEDGTIYICVDPAKFNYCHASLVDGKPVAAAGEIVINDGKITNVTIESGHYQPDDISLDNIKKELESRGVNVGEIKFTKHLDIGKTLDEIFENNIELLLDENSNILQDATDANGKKILNIVNKELNGPVGSIKELFEKVKINVKNETIKGQKDISGTLIKIREGITIEGSNGEDLTNLLDLIIDENGSACFISRADAIIFPDAGKIVNWQLLQVSSSQLFEGAYEISYTMRAIIDEKLNDVSVGSVSYYDKMIKSHVFKIPEGFMNKSIENAMLNYVNLKYPLIYISGDLCELTETGYLFTDFNSIWKSASMIKITDEIERLKQTADLCSYKTILPPGFLPLRVRISDESIPGSTYNNKVEYISYKPGDIDLTDVVMRGFIKELGNKCKKFKEILDNANNSNVSRNFNEIIFTKYKIKVISNAYNKEEGQFYWKLTDGSPILENATPEIESTLNDIINENPEIFFAFHNDETFRIAWLNMSADLKLGFLNISKDDIDFFKAFKGDPGLFSAFEVLSGDMSLAKDLQKLLKLRNAQKLCANEKTILNALNNKVRKESNKIDLLDRLGEAKIIDDVKKILIADYVKAVFNVPDDLLSRIDIFIITEDGIQIKNGETLIGTISEKDGIYSIKINNDLIKAKDVGVSTSMTITESGIYSLNNEAALIGSKNENLTGKLEFVTDEKNNPWFRSIANRIIFPKIENAKWQYMEAFKEGENFCKFFVWAENDNKEFVSVEIGHTELKGNAMDNNFYVIDGKFIPKGFGNGAKDFKKTGISEEIFKYSLEIFNPTYINDRLINNTSIGMADLYLNFYEEFNKLENITDINERLITAYEACIHWKIIQKGNFVPARIILGRSEVDVLLYNPDKININSDKFIFDDIDTYMDIEKDMTGFNKIFTDATNENTHIELNNIKFLNYQIEVVLDPNNRSYEWLILNDSPIILNLSDDVINSLNLLINKNPNYFFEFHYNSGLRDGWRSLTTDAAKQQFLQAIENDFNFLKSMKENPELFKAFDVLLANDLTDLNNLAHAQNICINDATVLSNLNAAVVNSENRSELLDKLGKAENIEDILKILAIDKYPAEMRKFLYDLEEAGVKFKVTDGKLVGFNNGNNIYPDVVLIGPLTLEDLLNYNKCLQNISYYPYSEKLANAIEEYMSKIGVYKYSNKIPDISELNISSSLKTDMKQDNTDGKYKYYEILFEMHDNRMIGVSANTQFSFVILNDETIKIGWGHGFLANNAENVIYAGDIKINANGKISSINIASGHYRPTVEDWKKLVLYLVEYQKADITSTIC